MAQFDRNSQKENKHRGNEPSFNWRGVTLIVIAFTLIAMAMVFYRGGMQPVEDVPYNRFLELLENKQIVNDKSYPLQLVVEDGRPTQTLRGAYIRQGVGPAPAQPMPFRTTVYLNFTNDLQKKLTDAGMQPAIKTESNMLAQTLVGFLPIALFLLVLYFLFRQQIRMAGKGALNFGKSKARMLARDKNKITFRDVAGVEEAKDEVQELVEFLRDPKKFQKLGGRIPKGVLMVGPPGTGKTLLARAIAGEADVPFFSISGSDFVEMFVGVGASRVRDMFEQGKKSAPCIIFIDEIDAVGRHRGHGVGGGHDEREQTLNALLVEMDGFDTQEGVIIIAATNRPDVLDPALLRPGRFDRQITVNLPDVKGREEILRVHAKKVKLAEGVDLAVVARGTPGYSGAELANVINEAALLAARRGLKGITLAELEEARDKVRWGKERRSLALSEKEKTNTAYHEAGHALLLELLPHTEPLHKVTIIPRGPSLGSTMWLPEEDKYTNRKNELLAGLAVSMGGRVAEEIVFGDITNGARGDIKMATSIARRMVCEWGMSEKMGMVEYGDHEDYVFLGRDISRARDYSEATAEQIDQEVKKLIDDAYQLAKATLTANRDKLEVIAKALLEFETLDGSQLKEIVEHGRLINPPPGAAPPPGKKMPPEKPPKQVVAAPDVTPPLPGALGGAPA
ncbi:MAG: cell division protein FtsH [Verrucomicrobia bacterium]|jgi:cell division protease FtsH|nr:MAG: cell division protein FtsH [Verrucomicrobiota bacterium]PYK50993.1 MAG: cell division protein FtsH [Verrucomicrobiota bacterium]PYL61651.1 MAG: cell division protein FtsH [Verrucomicrobiota bacterium]